MDTDTVVLTHLMSRFFLSHKTNQLQTVRTRLTPPRQHTTTAVKNKRTCQHGISRPHVNSTSHIGNKSEHVRGGGPCMVWPKFTKIEQYRRGFLYDKDPGCGTTHLPYDLWLTNIIMSNFKCSPLPLWTDRMVYRHD